MRELQKNIEQALSQKKVVILYGPRQVGKTTLMKKISKKYENSIFINAELPNVQEVFETQNPEYIISYFGNKKYIFIDEAQKISNIGIILKILYDSFPHLHIMATGSSSFELSTKLHEPLTGRNRTFLMLPLSLSEWQKEKNYSLFDIENNLFQYLRFGMYPEILNANSDIEKKEAIQELSSDYLYQDVLQFQNLKNPKLLRNLLKALALQVGSEVSYHELSQLLKTSSSTIEHYIDLLEKSFVIFTLSAFSTNPRKEISKKQKIYFYDVGILNALLDSFQSIEKRTDIGGLWENFCIVEQKKMMQNKGIIQSAPAEFFWRSYTQKEVDYIICSEGKMDSFEYKWNANKKIKAPKLFTNLYPESSFTLVNPKNLFIILKMINKDI